MKLCVVFCCFLALVSTCGVTQHNYIAHKALGWFNPAEQVQEDFGIFLDILQQNQDAFQNGAAFPDWGYSCGESDASEEAHWPPFTLAYTEYFIKQCTAVPGNWTGECPKLVAFLFGIVSHQVADVLWHDLAIVDSTKQGFIQAMANTDFGGNYGDAHSAADAGGEFIIAREFDLSFIQREWYLPAGDLSVLYNRLHHDITPEKLIECNLLLYAEVHAVKEGGALLYPYAARKSGFLSDEIKDYWMGGIDDNSVWTLWCWYEYLMSWLTSDGKDIAEFPVCLAQQPLFGDCPDVCPYPARRPVVSEQILSLATNLVNTTNAFVTEHSGKRGVTISHGSEFSQTLQNNMKELFPAFSQRNSEGDPVFPVVSDAAVQNTTCGEFMSELPSFYGTVANSYVGQSFSSGDLNNDGLTDVIIGAPGWSNNGLPQLGAIHILYGNKSLSALHNNQSISSPFLIGTSAHDRFGWASAILDLNKDGMNDIVVSSPTYSAANLTYRGELSIFWGTPTGVFSTTPNLLISSSVNFTNLGDSLTTFDCDSDGFLDLLVSAPFAGSGTASPQQKGKVILLLASDSQYSSSSSIYIEDIATWILEGDNSNNLFGRHIEPVESSGLGAPSMLIVGAPTVGSGSGSSREIGTVYGYNLDELMKGRDQQTALMFSIKGEDAWDQTGFSFSVGSLDKYSQVLGLAAPARKTGEVEEQFGAVFFYDVSSLQGSHSLYGDTNIDVLQGDQRYARFGYRCVFDQPSSNSTSSWWVSQPRRDYNERNPEAGAVFRWNSDRLPEHPRDPLAANECWASTVGKIRFGETLHFADVNGNGVTDVLFGSPRWGNDLVGSYSILIR